MRALLGVSGGIAAYKACDLVSRMRKRGWEVRVMMTPSATRFVGPLTFEGLSNNPVMTDALGTGHSSGPDAVEHIAWAKWAEVAVVAPMTANTQARLAMGLASDPVSTVLLALPEATQVVLAPAMNTQMWLNPITQRNAAWLQDTGRFHYVDPIVKRLACGDVGVGALADNEDILATIDGLPTRRGTDGG